MPEFSILFFALTLVPFHLDSGSINRSTSVSNINSTSLLHLATFFFFLFFSALNL
ncbi:hypothetical protein B0H14DRAFT_2742988, partial [Mycena olivaceomarginata]